MNNLKLSLAFFLGMISSYLFVAGKDGTYITHNGLEVENVLPHCIKPTEQLKVNKQKLSENKKSVEQSSYPQKIMSFLGELPKFKAESYERLTADVSAQNAAYYFNLNQDLFNAFTFTNQEELKLLLANGFPYPEELEYVYSQSMDELISVIDERRAKYNVNDPEFNQTVKLGVLAFNRAMDEFVDVLRQYRPDYQVGDPLPEMQQLLKGELPVDLEIATKRMMVLQGKAAGNIASSYLTAAKFNQINLYSAKPDYLKHQRLTNLAMADVILQTRRVQENLWPNTRDMPPEFIAIQTALLNIDLPSGSCTSITN